ncbi:MAG: cobalamin-binding protein [Gammaproteobacteria bacterium]
MPQRIVTLLPSATEMVCALGLREYLVGVSHECDYPPGVERLPHVTSTRIAHTADSASIDRQVRQELAAKAALYHVNAALLAKLAPDLLVTQSLCDVCAVAADEVEAAACGLPRAPRIFNLQPERLGDILANLLALGEVAQATDAARALHRDLSARIELVKRRTARISESSRPKVAMLEWLDPLFDAGHWNPELVALAGGIPVLGRIGQPSMTIDWPTLQAADSDLLFIACCGFDRERGMADVEHFSARAEWQTLTAVKTGRVWIADGNAYFNRPGPRIVDSLELLAHVLHPSVHPMPDGITPAARYGGNVTSQPPSVSNVLQ